MTLAADFWGEHTIQYRECRECSLCDGADKHVLFDGMGKEWESYPDILVVGEAPGMSEDTLGKPFVGPSGQLLRKCIVKCGLDRDYNVVLTNMVSCWPHTSEDTSRAPTAEEVSSCRRRLADVMEYCMPRVIVAVGRVAAHYIKSAIPAELCDVTIVYMTHPAHALRNGAEAAYKYGHQWETLYRDLKSGKYAINE